MNKPNETIPVKKFRITWKRSQGQAEGGRDTASLETMLFDVKWAFEHANCTEVKIKFK